MEFKYSDNGIWFNADKHVYLNKEGEKYTSGTAFVSKFKPEFDSDFWLKYKAAERVINYGAFCRFKDEYKFLDSKDVFISNIEDQVKLEGKEKEFLDTIEIVKGEWKEKSDKALSKGNRYHDFVEEKIRKAYNIKCDYSGIDLAYPNLPVGIHPEVRLYNHEHKIAGSADRITILKNGFFTILDYKTSAKINMTGYYDRANRTTQKMKAPISDLDDCNYTHYSLQLSLYAWMLEQHGYKCRNLKIRHATGRKTKHITVPYLKRAIELMLDYNKDNS